MRRTYNWKKIALVLAGLTAACGTELEPPQSTLGTELEVRSSSFEGFKPGVWVTMDDEPIYQSDSRGACEVGYEGPGIRLSLIMLEKGLSYVVTLDDLIHQEEADSAASKGQTTRLQLAELAFKKALAAGVPIVYGSGATSELIPHGVQADQFRYYVAWGMTPAQALQTAFLNAARMLNYDWETEIGSIEPNRFPRPSRNAAPLGISLLPLRRFRRGRTLH